MTSLRHIHTRMTLLVLLGLAIIGVGAALAATRAQTELIGTGVVVINTSLGYQNGQAAGTGMVLTSSGEVLTNNHVIEGATSITVVVPGTTHTYTARVVGYDVADDVAVLRLVNASSLRTVTIATATPKLGATVTAVGNANGGGKLVSATGTVTGLGKSIMASDGSGSGEQLAGLIETDANVQPGDSGGPLLNSAGRVVGMDTAGSTSGGGPFAQYSESDAYAIPIGRAVAIAEKIVAGKSSATIHVGATALLGIQVAQGYEGVTIAGVVANGPAAKAGLVAGDVITSIDGRAISSPDDVQAIVLEQKPGRKVNVTTSRGTVTVTLGSGPAQ